MLILENLDVLCALSMYFYSGQWQLKAKSKVRAKSFTSLMADLWPVMNNFFSKVPYHNRTFP